MVFARGNIDKDLLYENNLSGINNVPHLLAAGLGDVRTFDCPDCGFETIMFAKEIYQNRRQQLVEEFDSGLILLLGNNDAPMNAADNCYRFRQDSSFLYFCGLDQAGFALLLDVDEGKEILFGPDQTSEDVIWSGALPSLKSLAERAGLSLAEPIDGLACLLRAAIKARRPLHFLPSCRCENKIQLAELTGLSLAEVEQRASGELIRAVVSLRSIKDPGEIAELDAAADLGGEIHAVARQMARPGVYEWQIAGALEAAAARAGRPLSFPPIVTTHGEILHNHQRHNRLQKGDLLLVDCGVESPLHYASDHTRTIPVGGSFSSRQRDLYQVVLACLTHARQLIRPGIPFLEVHLATCRTLASGLKDLGLMRGNVEQAVAEGAHALFMPHGLGHMIGLDVHDMEDLGEDYVGYDDKYQRSQQFGTARLRLGRELQAGFALTVEPGLYFIPMLIEQWKNAHRHAEFVNYTKLSEYLGCAGVRLEDDLLVTADGNRLLGRPIPLEIEDIEACAGKKLDDSLAPL